MDPSCSPFLLKMTVDRSLLYVQPTLTDLDDTGIWRLVLDSGAGPLHGGGHSSLVESRSRNVGLTITYASYKKGYLVYNLLHYWH